MVTVGVSIVPAVRASRVAPLEALRESAAEPVIRPGAARAVAAGLVLLAGRGWPASWPD